jgi:hypothetical protein
MTLHSYLWSLRFFVLTAFVSWMGVVYFIGPQDLGIVAVMLFYLTFFLFASGMSVLILTMIWHRLAFGTIQPRELSVTLRQGILIGLLLVIILMLQQLRILVWWDALMAVTAILLIELFFLTRK